MRSAQPVQDNHVEMAWNVSCLSFPSVLHLSAMHSSLRSSGFSISQGSPELMSAWGQSLLLLSAVTTRAPLAVPPRCIRCSFWYLSPKLFDRFYSSASQGDSNWFGVRLLMVCSLISQRWRG